MNQLVIKKKNELSKKKKGFTLIELIIVIAIIAVLAAIAIPKFGAVKKDANIAADQANAKIIATAVASAVADGQSITDGEAKNSSNYAAYIDGKEIPQVKSEAKSSFYVKHTVDGTTITLGKVDGKKVYPPTNSAEEK